MVGVVLQFERSNERWVFEFYQKKKPIFAALRWEARGDVNDKSSGQIMRASQNIEKIQKGRRKKRKGTKYSMFNVQSVVSTHTLA
jgi:hypothetical protein